MAKVLRKIHCPYHKDDTESMAIYADGFAFCFGCRIRVPSDQVGEAVTAPISTPVYKEDMNASIERIRALPKTSVRGLELPSDETSYYILWPTLNYYKRRLIGATKDKYKSPVGHKKPLYVHSSPESRKLVIIEGEINCLTASLLLPLDALVLVSPGSASELNRADYLRYYDKFDRIAIIVDKDAAGVSAGIELKGRLQARGKLVTLTALERDLNEILVQEGRERASQTLSKALALLRVR